MRKEEFFIPSNDGITKLHCIAWIPDEEPRAVLQITHGMVEYIGRYDAFASFMAEHDIAVIGHDHLGHGQSVTGEEKLGYFCHEQGGSVVIEDIYAVTKEAAARWPGKKIFLLGHSMGSFMVRRYLALHSAEISGAVIMGTGWIPAPLAGIGLAMSRLTMFFRGEFFRSRLLTSLALGSNNKPFEPARTPNDWLSRNTENVDRYQADPLCGYMFTAAAYRDFFTVLKLVAAEDGYDSISPELPILIVSGGEDPVGGKTACPKVLEGYKKRGFLDVTMKLYPEDRHEILNELDRENVYGDILRWMEERIK